MNNTTYTHRPTEKQLRMITALSWKLHPFYLFPQWQEITTKMDLLLAQADRKCASSLIQRMLTVLNEKEQSNAKQVWIPMDYRLTNPTWQNNLKRLAKFIFPESQDTPEIDAHDLTAWRELKNRLEREEQKRATEFVEDTFEHDPMPAIVEEDRWKQNRPSYAQMIEGIDFLTPVPEIDF